MSATPPNDPWQNDPWQGPPGDRTPPPAPPPPPPGGGSWGQPGGFPPPPGAGYPPPPGAGYPPPPPYNQGYPPPPGPGWGQPGPGWGPGPQSPAGYLAGWWPRVGATVVDILVFIIPGFIIGALTRNSNGTNYGGGLIVFVIYLVYATLMLSSRGQTLGNKAVGTRVVDANTGGSISAGRALGRTVANVLFWIVLILPWFLDMLFPLWDGRNQTLHDKIAGTVVIKV